VTTTTPPAAEPDPPADHADEPPSDEPPSDEPDVRLAALLEACLRAERAQPGGALRLVQTVPEAVRAELLELLALGCLLRRGAHAPDPDPPLPALRARLMAHIAAHPLDQSPAGGI